MRSPLFVTLAVALVGLAWAEPAQAQFRNNGIQVQLGYLGLGSIWDRVINGGNPAKQGLGQGADAVIDEGWNLQDQPTVGVAYYRAIGYQTWWDSQAVIGANTTVLDANANPTPVLTTQISTGLRYNFLEERHRPYVAAHITYLQLIALGEAVPPIPGNGFLGNTPFFIGVRPGFGYEWVFGDEQSLQAELDIAGFVVPDADRGLASLFLPATVARVGYNIYF